MDHRELLTSLATIIGDYRRGNVPRLDEAHIERWLHQFESANRSAILEELDHIFARTYLTSDTFENFATDAVTDSSIAVDLPLSVFWARARFVKSQGLGKSQETMLGFMGKALLTQHRIEIAECGVADGPLVYVDDAIYTGMTVINELTPLIGQAPSHTELYVCVAALHTQGATYAAKTLTDRFRAAGKTVKLTWLSPLRLDTSSAETSDVLWPKALPPDDAVRAYAASLTRPFPYRSGNSRGTNALFRSTRGRDILEQEFLKAGVLIRSTNPNLKRFARPLGNIVMDRLGFGALVVTYRNCANNCPLVFWAADYPLFHRENN